MAKGTPRVRATRALDRILGHPTRATVGWRKSETNVVITVPGRANYVYVTRADQTVLIARNEANVPHAAFYPVKMRLDGNTWIITGRDSSNADVLGNLPDDGYGVPSHPHALSGLSDVVLTSLADDEVLAWDAATQRWVNVTQAGALVTSVNGQTGAVVLDTDDIAEGASNLYLTQERVEDYVAAQLTGNTGRVQFAYDDGTGALTAILDVSVADRILYSIGADAWAETALTAFMRTLLDDADEAAARTTLGLAAGGAGDIWVEKAGDEMTGDLQVNQNIATNYVATDATHNSHVIVRNQQGGDTDSVGYGMTISNSSAVAQAAWWGVISETGAAVFSPIVALKVRTGASTYAEALRVDSSQRLLVSQIIRAMTSSGMRLEDDGGNLGIFLEDGGNVGFGGITDPRENIHVADHIAFELDGFIRVIDSGGTSRSLFGTESVDDTVSFFNNLNGDGGAIRFRTQAGGAETARFDENGKFMVGLTSVGASIVGVKAGSSSNDAAVGGMLYVTTTQTGNVGTGDDTLASYTVPAATLAANNQHLVLEAYGTTASTANAKTLSVSFGGSSIFADSLTTSVVTRWRLQVIIYRTGATSVKYVVTLWTNDDLNSITIGNGTASPTLSSSNALTVIGTATSNNDIVLEAMSVEFKDANT